MKRPWLPALLLVVSAPAAAQVHKCTGPDGSPVYQQQPCAEGAEGEKVREISITPGMSEDQRQEIEAMRQARAQAESSERQERITEAQQEFRRIQRENADPERCQQARGDIILMQQRGERESSTDLFMARERVKLYCNP